MYFCYVRMKRVSTIFLLALYLVVTSGIVLNIHYCMGEVSNIAIATDSKTSCSTCGMDNDGCCHDDVKLVKLSDSHQPSWIQDDLFQFSIPLVRSQSTSVPEIRTKVKFYATHAHAPPLKESLNLFHCVFRI